MTSSAPTTTSDHLAIAKVISEFTREHPKTYDECVAALLKIVETHFPGLTQKTSPIEANLDNWDREDLAFLLLQYSCWTNETIHMFLDSRIRTYWESVRNEIDRNVGEEMGELTAGIPHLELMRQGHLKELELDTDKAVRAGVTQDFLTKMRKIFIHKDNAYSAGALLAFEGVATEEFKVTDSFMHRRKALLNNEVGSNSYTDMFVYAHVAAEGEVGHPEDSHKEGLLNAIKPHINEGNIHRFIQGFFAVCVNLNMFWERLAVETYYLKIERESLTVTDPEAIDFDSILKSQSAHG